MSERGVTATTQTIVLVLLVFVAQVISLEVGFGIEYYALGLPLEERPWTIITSVYAHAGTAHLLSNIVGLAIFGYLVERRSSRPRFHLFVVVSGATACVAEVVIASLFDVFPLVLGISGAVFALMGYVLSSNPVTRTVLGWVKLSVPTQLLLMLVLAVAITWFTRGERVALIAHFTGFLLGLVSGRMRLLRVHR